MWWLTTPVLDVPRGRREAVGVRVQQRCGWHSTVHQDAVQIMIRFFKDYCSEAWSPQGSLLGCLTEELEGPDSELSPSQTAST